MFSLRFDPRAIEFWASRFPDGPTALRIMNEIAPRTRARGYLDKADFLTICEWNSTRPRKLYRANAPDFVREITRAAFATKHERVRIEVLMLLKGVSMATASVLLHFCSTDPYPILDVNSLWSLQAAPPRKYDFDFWWQYVQVTRKLAKQARVDMRTLDRALWQYAQENQ
ncbi:MAG: hypothetical protein HY741_08175 [Chloroflexi bacterium]|nr:hypothetical protein [Chloroflexota bacterium]